jgi:predicted metalloprotease
MRRTGAGTITQSAEDRPVVRFRRPAAGGNVEDRRGARIPGGAAGAGWIGGIIVLVILVAAALMGVDLGPISGGNGDPYGGSSSLTAEEEQRLAHEYRRDRDTRAAHALVTANLRFVVKVAYE